VEHLVHQVDAASAGLLVEHGGRAEGKRAATDPMGTMHMAAEHMAAGHTDARDTGAGDVAAAHMTAEDMAAEDMATEHADTEHTDTEYLVSTHVARAPVGRFVVVVSWRGGPEPEEVRARLLASVPGLLLVDGALVSDPSLAPGALATAGEALRRSSGRLARYRGRLLVERRTTPAEAVAVSCLDAVEGLAGVEVSPDAVLDATGFARPTWRDGRCTLLVQRGGGGVLVPFEVRDQLACCSDH
jgi:hypothetical protein